MQHDPRSREHYHRLRGKGHSHGRALRGLPDRLLALLCPISFIDRAILEQLSTIAAAEFGPTHLPCLNFPKEDEYANE
jgi:hypothetical protein